MITYKNIGQSTKTFYGVTFKPGEIKEVPGYINSLCMIRVFNTSEIQLSRVPKKRGYSKKPITVESKPLDSTSSKIKEENIIKEEIPDGEH